MQLEKCLEKIERYIRKTDVLPLIVDLQNPQQLQTIIDKFIVGDNKLLQFSNFAILDECPQFDKLFDQIETDNSVIFVSGVSSFLRLYGEHELNSMLLTMANTSVAGHVIFLTYQCSEYLQFNDPRMMERIAIVDGDRICLPHIFLTASRDYCSSGEIILDGIDHLADAVESRELEIIYIVTKHRKTQYTQSLYRISALDNAFEAMKKIDGSTTTLNDSMGTSDQWNYALDLLKKHHSWKSVIENELANIDSLDVIFTNYNELDPNECWLLFIGLKLFQTKNAYLKSSVECADSNEQLIQSIYRSILSYSCDEPYFEKLYLLRKSLVKGLTSCQKELSDYCQLVYNTKGKEGLQYLTDVTPIECETIYAILDKYGFEYTKEELILKLKTVYPALSSYLEPYSFKDELLTNYFNQYTYLKVINKISESFYKIVEEQSEKRDFFRILQFRPAIVETLYRESAALFFIDAMGVEYLSYIKRICETLGLSIKVNVCRCELPSTTPFNKEFEGLFRPADIRKSKELDALKHHGINNCNYEVTHLPIHLSEELNLLMKYFKSIKDLLLTGGYSKVIVLSDHGSSRLAVINESESQWSMKNKGEHSGRCVLKADVEERPDCAADAGDYWALANYDRFKGGRKADVEVHGGATLEEVTIPIIEVTLTKSKIEIILAPLDIDSVIPGTIPVIYVSFRKKASLKIVVIGGLLENPFVVVDDKQYAVNYQQDGCMIVTMPDVKTKGIHKMTIYSSGSPVAEDLEFEVKKESGSERELL